MLGSAAIASAVAGPPGIPGVSLPAGGEEHSSADGGGTLPCLLTITRQLEGRRSSCLAFGMSLLGAVAQEAGKHTTRGEGGVWLVAVYI